MSSCIGERAIGFADRSSPEVQSPSAFRFEELAHHTEQALRDSDVIPFRLGPDGHLRGPLLLLRHDPVTKLRAHRIRSSNSDARTMRATHKERMGEEHDEEPIRRRG